MDSHEISLAAGAELIRDLEMVAAIVNRAHRRLTGAEAVELDRQQRIAAPQKIDQIEKQLQRMANKPPALNKINTLAQTRTAPP